MCVWEGELCYHQRHEQSWRVPGQMKKVGHRMANTHCMLEIDRFPEQGAGDKGKEKQEQEKGE